MHLLGNDSLKFATATLALILSLPASGAIPSHCDNQGHCPGLGEGVFLNATNVFDAKVNLAGHKIFKDSNVGSCAVVVEQQFINRGFTTFDDETNLTKNLNTSFGLEASVPVQLFNLGATVDATTGHSLVKNEVFKSVELEILFGNQLVNFQQTSACLSPSNIDPVFLANFEALALPDPEQAGTSFTWASYTQLLKNYGSHVQIQQQVGSRVQQWVSTKSDNTVTSDQLQSKACLNLEGYGTPGWSASPCAGVSAEKRLEVSKIETNDQLYITGGTVAARTALTQKFDERNLNDFIASASQGDQPIGFRYLPIWSVLQEVYRASCGLGGKGSAACQNLQRASMLQAAYEGYLAFDCSQKLDGRNATYQTMQAHGPDGNGIYYFSCHQSKTGCRENTDCSSKASAQCDCQGPGCIASNLIPGTLLERNTVKGAADGDRWNSSLGVNASCEGKFDCDCNEGWAGGAPERDIWDQAGAGSGSVAMSLAVPAGSQTGKALATPDSADPTTYKVRVGVYVQPRHNAREEKQAELAIAYAQAQGDASNNRVVSDPKGIDCPGVCEASFPVGSKITLSYANNLDHRFVEWTGNDCDLPDSRLVNRAKTCLIGALNENKRVGAIFQIKKSVK